MNSNSGRSQRTLAGEAVVRGIGFVTEVDVTLRFRPADPDRGVTFRRVDLPDRPTVQAHIRNVVSRQRRTTIQDGPAIVEMVEHVMAALAGLRIDNCDVEIDAGETPGCDGSSQAFVDALRSAGSREQNRPCRSVRITAPICVREGSGSITASPGDPGKLMLSYQLDYGAHPAIGSQSYFLEVEEERFQTEIAPSRTFLLEQEAQVLRNAGLGSRLSPSDLLIFGADGPIENTLRYRDECVRHKILDMIGDLALAGVDIEGQVMAHRSGHQLNARMVEAILAQSASSEDRGPSVAPGLDITSIKAILPHRYPFLLIDRVVSIEDDRRVEAIKCVSYNEPFFQGHWPGRPIMPGVLIVEAMAQAAGIILGRKFGGATRDVVIAGIDRARIRRPVVPGDQLRLEAVVRRLSSRLTEMDGFAYVGEERVAEARLKFAFVDRREVA